MQPEPPEGATPNLLFRHMEFRSMRPLTPPYRADAAHLLSRGMARPFNFADDPNPRPFLCWPRVPPQNQTPLFRKMLYGSVTFAPVAESVDAPDSKSGGLTLVLV